MSGLSALLVARLHPASDDRLSVGRGGTEVVLRDDKKGTSRRSAFNAVLDRDATAAAVAAVVSDPAVDSAAAGLTTVVMATGVSGSGKTHTTTGLFESAVRRLFANKLVTSVSVSAYEVDDNKCYDLLGAGKGRVELGVMVSKGKRAGFVVRDCVRLAVNAPDEALAVYNRAMGGRATSETANNAHSSRSHAFVRVRVLARLGSDSTDICSGAVVFVDLAGAEAMADTEGTAAQGQTKDINSSLSALTRFVSDLQASSSNDAAKRQTTLNMLLTGALVGTGARLCVLATLVTSERHPPHQSNKTLRFCEAAVSIKSTARARIYHEADKRRQIKVLVGKLAAAEDRIRRLSVVVVEARKAFALYDVSGARYVDPDDDLP